MKLLFQFSLILSLQVHGQSLSRQSISSSGNANSGNGVTIQQTVGQPYQTKTHQSGSTVFRPGFQQPVFSAELLSATTEVIISPNPALLSFFIKTTDVLFNAELNVYDERGRLIYSEKFAEFNKTEVECSMWANGVYMATLSDRNKNLITAKLIKHQ